MTGEAGQASYVFNQTDMIHRLPRVRLVDRIEWLMQRCRNKSVIHVGFADTGFREQQQRSNRWLHAHLNTVSAELVGIDTDPTGVNAAIADGYEAHVADCTDPAAVSALGLAPAEVVVAGEVIEHVDAPGPFLDGLRMLCRSDGQLIITTPNAYGLANPISALLLGAEINHPDHVVMFTWRTLTELLRRHGWQVVESATYVPAVRRDDRSGWFSSGWLRSLGAQVTLSLERLLGRLGRPFCADGLIVVASPMSVVDTSVTPVSVDHYVDTDTAVETIETVETTRSAESIRSTRSDDSS